MLVYFGAVAGIFFIVGIWHIGLIIPTSLWVITVGIISAFRSMNVERKPVSFREVSSVSLVAGWFVSLYTFAFVLELVYQSLAALLAGMAVLVERRSPKEHAVANVAYVALVIAAVIPPILGLIQRPFDRGYIESLLLPVIGLLALLPLVHVLGLYVLYEGINSRLRLYAGSDDVRRYALLQTFRHFHVRLSALRRFRTAAARDLFWSKTSEDVDELFRRYGRRDD